MIRERLDRLIGLALALIAACICLISFWLIGGRTRDALVLTDYFIHIGLGEQRSFGFGGEGEGERVDVPFQGRELSNVSFLITRDGAGRYQIAGRDDDISMHRIVYAPGEKASLENGDRFECRGPLGRATFRTFMDGETDTLRLHLVSPLFRELRPGTTRIAFRLSPHPIPSTIDEIFFRVGATAGADATSFRAWVERDCLYLNKDNDLARPDAEPSQDAARSVDGRPRTPGAVPAQDAAAPACVKPGEALNVPGLRITFRHYPATLNGFLGLNQVRFYGIKLSLAILLLAAAFVIAPQARWPFGMTIFGCAALFASIGIVLSARDFFFFPHHERFREYISYLSIALMVLFALRVPFSIGETASRRTFLLRLSYGGLSLLVACRLINSSFDMSEASITGMFSAALGALAGLVFCLALSLIIQVVCKRQLVSLSELLWPASRFRSYLFVPMLLVIALVLVTRLMGGREALTLLGVRIHLPTLLLPVMVLWSSIIVSAAEYNPRYRKTWLILGAWAILTSLFAYRLLSGDNGGSAILAFGILIVFWIGSSKWWDVPLFITLMVVCGGLGWAWLTQSTRFDIAWGGQEGQVLYYDQAKNLRLARDMARNGGAFGHNVDLLIPTEVRSNIHSDLAAAYVVGFFGWAIFALLMFGFWLFYNQLFFGLYEAFFPGRVAVAGSDRGRSSPAEPVEEKSRSILAVFTAALVSTFALQTLWVSVATLQGAVPLTGLDLQPISTSAISVLSFFIILLGSVALSHNIMQTLPEYKSEYAKSRAV